MLGRFSALKIGLKTSFNQVTRRKIFRRSVLAGCLNVCCNAPLGFRRISGRWVMTSHFLRVLAMFVGALFVVASVCSFHLQLHGVGESFWGMAKLVPAFEMAVVASALSLMVPSMHYGQGVYALHDSWANDGRAGLSQRDQVMLLPEALLTGSSIRQTRGGSPYAGHPELEVLAITYMIVTPVLLVAFTGYLERIPSHGRGVMIFASLLIPLLHGIVNAAYVHALKKRYLGRICFLSQSDVPVF